ncbi:MAG TPA: hypothetical protein PLM24_00205 [Methanothrix sp.]|nr:hypothetical protein [Methanothrix sp.]
MTRFIVVPRTTSHSGKSTIVAALCRILKNRGLAVAPFKSQNMSLNSWVTSEGKEMGIVQAWAAGIEPTELMNSILLKPKCSSANLAGLPRQGVQIPTGASCAARNVWRDIAPSIEYVYPETCRCGAVN